MIFSYLKFKVVNKYMIILIVINTKLSPKTIKKISLKFNLFWTTNYLLHYSLANQP